MSAILNEAKKREDREKEEQRIREEQRKVQVQRLSQEEFARRVEERQRKTGTGEYGKGGSKDVRAEAVAKQEIKVAAERRAHDEKSRASGGLTAGKRDASGKRKLSATGERPQVTEQDVQRHEREILKEKTQAEIERQRQIERQGGPNQTPGVYTRITQEQERRQRADAERRVSVSGTPSGPQGRVERFADGSTRTTFGLEIVGGKQSVKRSQLTSDQLKQVKELEAGDPDWKYAGELTANEDGSYTFYGQSITEGKRYREELLAYKKESFEQRQANVTAEKQAEEFNKMEERRVAQEEKRIFAEAKDLGYEVKKTETKNADGSVQYEYEYVPIKGKKQYAYIEDPTNPYAPPKKVPVENIARAEAVEKFQSEYEVRDPSALGQYGEFGRGIKAQGESYAEIAGHKPEDVSALNTLLGINQYKGKYEKREGETEAEFRQRVRKAEAKKPAGGKPDTYIDERGRVRGRSTVATSEPAYGSEEYQKRKVFESISKNPARFAGEVFVEGALFAAGGEVVSLGAKGGAKVVKVVKNVIKKAPKPEPVPAPKRSFSTMDDIATRIEEPSMSGTRQVLEVKPTAPKTVAKTAKKPAAVDNKGRFTREDIERGLRQDTAEPSMKPSREKLINDIKPDLDESQRIDQTVRRRPDIEVRPTLESDVFIDIDKGFGSFKGGGGGGKPPKGSEPGDGSEKKVTTMDDILKKRQGSGSQERPPEGFESGSEGQVLLMEEPRAKPKGVRPKKKLKDQEIDQEIRQQVDEYHDTPKSLERIYDEVVDDQSLRLKQKKTKELIERKQPEVDQAVRDSDQVTEEIKQLDSELEQLNAEEAALKEEEILGAASPETVHANNHRLAEITTRKTEITLEKDKKIDDLNKIQERKANVERDIESIKSRRKIRKEEFLGAKQRVFERKIKKEGKVTLEESGIARPQTMGVSLTSIGFGGETGVERAQAARLKKVKTVPQEEYIDLALPSGKQQTVQEVEFFPRQGQKQKEAFVIKDTGKFDDLFITTPKQDVKLTTGQGQRQEFGGRGKTTTTGKTPTESPKVPERPGLTGVPFLPPSGGGGGGGGEEPKQLGGVGIKDYGVENILFEPFSLTEKGTFKYSGKEVKDRFAGVDAEVGLSDVQSILFGGKGKKGKKSKGLFDGLL